MDYPTLPAVRLPDRAPRLEGPGICEPLYLNFGKPSAPKPSIQTSGARWWRYRSAPRGSLGAKSWLFGPSRPVLQFQFRPKGLSAGPRRASVTACEPFLANSVPIGRASDPGASGTADEEVAPTLDLHCCRSTQRPLGHLPSPLGAGAGGAAAGRTAAGAARPGRAV